MDAFTEKGLTEAGGDICFFMMGGVVNDLGLGYIGQCWTCKYSDSFRFSIA